MIGNTAPFEDRADAGRQLAHALRHLGGQPGLLVLALPRGGVPVAFLVAQALHAELDLMLVRKLGLPHHPEYAMGAIGSGGARVLQAGVPGPMGVTADEVEAVTRVEQAELERRARRYRGARPAANLLGRTVVLVDDGIATGASMRVAIEVARLQQPARLVVATPVAPRDTLQALQAQCDEVVCLVAPPRFRAVGQWYRRFDQTGDDEVQDLLARAWSTPPGRPTPTI